MIHFYTSYPSTFIVVLFLPAFPPKSYMLFPMHACIPDTKFHNHKNYKQNFSFLRFLTVYVMAKYKDIVLKLQNNVNLMYVCSLYPTLPAMVLHQQLSHHLNRNKIHTTTRTIQCTGQVFVEIVCCFINPVVLALKYQRTLHTIHP
jgi:hypothetical protein